MRPHKQPMVRRARRWWRAHCRRPEKPEGRRWYKKELRKARDLRVLGDVEVPKHLGDITECSQCYAFTTVLGAAVKNWKETKESEWVCQVCDSCVFLCHCGWCQVPLFYTDAEDVNCRSQGVQSLLCCGDCSIHHYCNYTGG